MLFQIVDLLVQTLELGSLHLLFVLICLLVPLFEEVDFFQDQFFFFLQVFYDFILVFSFFLKVRTHLF